MIKLKQGVDLRGLRPEILMALTICDQIFCEVSKDCVVTSATDSRHLPTSLHYRGYALDLRTKHLSAAEVETVYGRIKEAIGKPAGQFDVVLEDRGKTNQHIHIEFDPKEVA